MSYSVLATPVFSKELKRLNKKYPSVKSEIIKLVASLKAEPEQGVRLANNCFKIRLSIASKGKGKSGGARVITYVLVNEKSIYLLSIYDKSERESISDKQLRDLLKDLPEN
jgi:mRNA-degrading endonuclease RelE of RelBE toxin-antitoxin system